MALLKVLIVDDEPGIRSGVVRILRNYKVAFPFIEEDFSFELIEAATGEEALKILERQAIDIVLLDNKLPGIMGIDVLEKIKKEKEFDVSVMIITSYASLELAIKATQNGAYNFVPKPFTPEELRIAMENIVKHLFLKRMTRKMQKEGKHLRFQFLSVLSHELKSPLNAVEGYLHMLQEKQLGDKVDDYQHMVDRSLERIKGMRKLILDLLDLTKLESGKKPRLLKPVDLAEIARIAIDTFEPIAIQKEVNIHLEVTGEPYLDADLEEMEIIFNNLISNAVKYNYDKGSVTVSIHGEEDKMMVVVEDTGIGMTEEERLQVFGEFVRVRNRKTKDIPGSGLGLSLVKRLVEQYKADIDLLSEPDKGSRFTIIFPKK